MAELETSIEALLEIMRRLRDPEIGCPWDREQDFASIAPYTIEEAYEVAGAIEDGDWASLKDELGDLLFQVVFHARMAEERGLFGFQDVVAAVCEKMLRRHPHVFGEVDVESAADVKRNWDQIKDAERGASRDSLMDGVPSGMPALQRASKVQNRAAKAGFDWEKAKDVLPKIQEELAELEAVLDDPAESESELGDVLFSVVNLARHLGVDGEVALRGAIDRFEARFRHMEDAGPLDGLSLDDLNRRWEEAK